MNAIRFLIAAASSAALFASSLAAAGHRVIVAPSNVERAGVVVSFLLPDGAPKDAALRDAAGKTLPLQVDADGTGRFVVAVIHAREQPVFTLESAEVPPIVVVATTTADRVQLSVQGKPLFDYWTKEEPLPNAGVDPKFLRSGFIHPLRSPAGVVITASYPPSHLHHHGIWTSWSKTQFQDRTPNFWEMGLGSGKVEFAALDRTWSGPVHGGFVARHRYIDLSAPSPVVALDEIWEVRVYNVPDAARPLRMFDLAVTQTCATSDPLILPEYRYGGLGFRGREEWLDKEKIFFLTPNGETDRVKAHATRARWCHIGGWVDGAFAGVAIFDHSDNYRAPQPMRIHPEEPFFSYAPSQLGDWRINPGQPYIAHYRFIVMDGEPDRALLDAYWNGCAARGAAFVAEPLP